MKPGNYLATWLRTTVLGLTLLSLSVYSQQNAAGSRTSPLTIKGTANDALTLLIADSVAKAELNNFYNNISKSLLTEQLSLKYYDRSIKPTQKNTDSYQVSYNFNQPLRGLLYFFSFCVIVTYNTDKSLKETKFLEKGCGL
jgi:hypothetical protein